MFTSPAGGQMMNHLHASTMARAAHSRANIAKTLGSSGGIGPVTGPVPPVSPVQPVGPVPPASGNYKAHVAHHASRKGHAPSLHHVHQAIDALTQQGRFTPLQGAALKLHNGPLEGPAGQATIAAISNHITGGK